MAEKVKVGPKYQVVIPRSIREKVNIEPKREVLVEEVNGVIIIFPKPTSYTELMFGLGKDLWKGIDPKRYIKQERRNWK